MPCNDHCEVHLRVYSEYSIESIRISIPRFKSSVGMTELVPISVKAVQINVEVERTNYNGKKL